MTTYHAIQRTRERANLNERSSIRFIQNAVRRGKGAEYFGSKERNYLLRQEAKNGMRAILYNNYCFIIGNDNICITMFPTPRFAKAQYDGKRAIRNIKKYMRLYDLFENEDLEYVC